MPQVGEDDRFSSIPNHAESADVVPMAERSAKEIGDYIRSLMEEKKWSVYETATHVGCNHNSVRAWLAGKSKPNRKLAALAKAFGKDANQITGIQSVAPEPRTRAWQSFQRTRAYKMAKPWQIEVVRAAAAAFPPEREPNAATFSKILFTTLDLDPDADDQ